LAGDICDELSKTNAPFSAPTLIGSDDMTAPSFANQIHMTTGEDRRRSTHTHAQTSSSGNHLANPGWQVNSSRPIVQQFRRFSLAEAAATHDGSRRRECSRARRVIDDHISLTTMIPTKSLPNWCIDNICFPIGTLVEPSCDIAFFFFFPPDRCIDKNWNF
jgi:hypothetical protein